jgi:hypothetical protein
MAEILTGLPHAQCGNLPFMTLLLIIAVLIVVVAVATGGFFGPRTGRTTRIIDRTIDTRPTADEVVEEEVPSRRRVVRRRRY